MPFVNLDAGPDIYTILGRANGKVDDQYFCEECATTINRASSIIFTRKKCVGCRKIRSCSLTRPWVLNGGPNPNRHIPNPDDNWYLCPDCDAHITSCDYAQNVREYGTFDIESEDYSHNDSDTDSTDFYCPECNNEIDPYDLSQVDAESCSCAHCEDRRLEQEEEEEETLFSKGGDNS